MYEIELYKGQMLLQCVVNEYVVGDRLFVEILKQQNGDCYWMQSHQSM